jgi:hypothetical protein
MKEGLAKVPYSCLEKNIRIIKEINQGRRGMFSSLPESTLHSFFSRGNSCVSCSSTMHKATDLSKTHFLYPEA